MFRRFNKSTIFVACPLQLVAVLAISPTYGQQLPAPTRNAPVVIGETPAAAQPQPAGLPEPYLLPRQASPSSANPAPKRPSLGVVAEERADRTGLTVLSVRELSPADQAGVKEGDILTSLNGRQTNTIEDVSGALSPLRAGDPVTMEVARGKTLYELRASMSDAPPPAIEYPDTRDTARPATPAMQSSRGTLGVTVEDAVAPPSGAPAARGARVVAVAAHSPAESIGIRPGDTIVSIEGQVMYGARELTDYMRTARAGQSVEIGYYQDRVLRRKNITFGGSGDPLPSAEPMDRDRNPTIVIGPNSNVGEILQDVGRTIDSFLGPRRVRVLPQPAPLGSFVPNANATPAPPAIPTPSIATPRSVPTPAAEPTASPATPSADAEEVVRLRQQVQQLLERMQQLEQQIQQEKTAPAQTPTPEPVEPPKSDKESL